MTLRNNIVVLLIRQTARPPTARLGQIPGTTIYRNIRRFPNAREIPGVIIWRFDAPLSFTNKDYFKELILREIDKEDAIAKEHDGHNHSNDNGTNDKNGNGMMLGSSVARSDDELKSTNPDMPQFDMADLTVLPPANENLAPQLQPQVGIRERKVNPTAATAATPAPATVNGVPLFAPTSDAPYIKLHTMILDCSSIVDVDDSALSMLFMLIPSLRPRLLLAGVKGQVPYACLYASCYMGYPIHVLR
jgi:hypothetical protein